MAMTSFDLLAENRSINITDQGTAEVREEYLAVLDIAETNPAFIVNDPLVPRQNSQHPLWPGLFLQSIEANSSADSRKVWTVSLIYSSTSGVLDPNTQERQFDPERFDGDGSNIRVRWSFGTERRVIERARMFIGTHKYEAEEGVPEPEFNTYHNGSDDNGYMPMNSAGHLFSPTLTYDARYPIATIDRNELQVTDAIFNYQEAINSDSFVIDGVTIQPYVCRMLDIQISERKRDRGTNFRTVTYRLGFKKKEKVKIYGPLRTQASPNPAYFRTYECSGWDAVAVDAGLYERKEVDGTTSVVRARDEKGNPSTKPEYLDGNGLFLNMQDVTLQDDPTAEEISEWIRYRRYMYLNPLPFSPFNFY